MEITEPLPVNPSEPEEEVDAASLGLLAPGHMKDYFAHEGVDEDERPDTSPDSYTP
jgi:hypothetical protein